MRAPPWLAALLLGACATPGPRPPLPPGPEVPAAWRSTPGPALAIDRDWWRRFDDPVLTALVERALARNADIALAVARIQEARATEQAARAELRPDIGVGGDIARSRSVGALGTPLLQTAAGPQVQASYEIDLFGRLGALREAARLGVAASQATRDATALAVAAQTASSYITLRALDARLETARQTLQARALALHYARRRAETGYTSMLELRQAEAEYEATAQVIPLTERAIAQAENAIDLLIEAPSAPVARGRPLAALAFPPLPGTLPSELLRRRPDIAAAEAQVAASDARLSAARAAFLPRISLSASTGVAFSTALADPIALFSLGGSILAPLFDGGRLRANQNAVVAQREQAAIRYRGTVLTAFREVEDSLVAVDRLAREEASLDRQRRALADALRLASQRYRAGYAAYIEQLDAQRGLLAADLTIIQSRADRLNALVGLYRAVGGGWTSGS